MGSGKGHQDEEEEKDEEFGAKNDATASNSNITDRKNCEKANAVRSKHSVTEQRRRSKINERFQMLRKLIPHSDQKRDTASFLLEVIEYVQFLKGNVQKYEGSYRPCSSEPTKLMPWRNSHWNVQSIAGQPQNMTNVSCPGSAAMLSNQESPMESDAIRDSSFRSIDPANEVPNKPMSNLMTSQTRLPASITNDGKALSEPVSDAQSTEFPTAADSLNGHGELNIEGGTISISSAYSHRLLNSLTRALQSTGVDLSQASISVKVNLGKRANRQPTPEIPSAKDHDTPMSSGNHPVGPIQDANNNENTDQYHKRLKILQNG